MVQMLSKFLIAMSLCSDVKIPQDLIPFQTAINATRVHRLAPMHPRSLGELPPGIPSHLTHNVMDLRILFLRRKSPTILLTELLVLAPLGKLSLGPRFPARRLALEQFTRQNAITRRVLDVDADRFAGHVDDHVEVKLQVMRDAFFYRELVAFRPVDPVAEFAE